MKSKNLMFEEIVEGGIYEYYREDNNEVVYRGITTKTLEDTDKWNRDSSFIHSKSSHIKKILRFTIGNKLKIRWIVLPGKTTLSNLYLLQQTLIREKVRVNECYLNQDLYPFKKYYKKLKDRIKQQNFNKTGRYGFSNQQKEFLKEKKNMMNTIMIKETV